MNEGGHWAPLTGQQVEWIQGPDTTDTKLGGWAELQSIIEADLTS